MLKRIIQKKKKINSTFFPHLRFPEFKSNHRFFQRDKSKKDGFEIQERLKTQVILYKTQKNNT